MKQKSLLIFLCLATLIASNHLSGLVGPTFPGQSLWCISKNINLTAQTILDQLSTFSGSCPSSCNIIALSQSNVSGGNISLTTSGHYCLQENITLSSPSGAISLNANSIYLDLNNRCVNGNIIINNDFATVTNGVILAPAPSAVTIPNQAAITINSNYSEISNSTIITANTTTIPSRNGINIFGIANAVKNCIIQTGATSGGSSLNIPNSGDGILNEGNFNNIVDCTITTSNAGTNMFLGLSAGGNGGNCIIITATTNTVRQCTLSAGNGANSSGSSSGQPIAPGNGGIGIWIQNTAVNCYVSNNLVTQTGNAGFNLTAPNIVGQCGHGVQIDNGTLGIEIVNNIFSNMGTFTGTPFSTSEMGGLAINDQTTSSNQTYIYQNFAYNIAQDIPSGLPYKIHNTASPAFNILSPNPPTAPLINFIANVYTE